MSNNENKQKKRRTWPWVLILLILIALGLSWHFGLFGKGAGTGKNDGNAVESHSGETADKVTDKTDGEAAKEITVEVKGDKIILGDREITLDDLKSEVADFARETKVTLIDNDAVKAVYEEVLNELEAAAVELKTQDK